MTPAQVFCASGSAALHGTTAAKKAIVRVRTSDDDLEQSDDIMLRRVMNMQRTLAAVIGSALIIAPIGMSRAQTETDSAKAVRHDAAAAKLAKAAQNPVANMVSLPLQYNFTSGGGLDSSTALVLNVQPVLPLPIGERWLIIARTVVPFVSIPLPNGRQAGGSPTFRNRHISPRRNLTRSPGRLGRSSPFRQRRTSSRERGSGGWDPARLLLRCRGSG